MRIDELREREAFDSILRQTLSRAFTALFGLDVSCSAPGAASGQVWHEQVLLNAMYVPSLAWEPRKFVANSFRFTTVRHRIVPQFVLGSALAARAGLRAFGRPSFSVRPSLPGAEHILVMPGNHRVRVFDFSRSVVRSTMKVGFERAPMANELRTREAAPDGPFVPLIRRDIGNEWFEEPIIVGHTLARRPPWHRGEPLVAAAFNALRSWALPSMNEVSAKAHLEMLVDRIELAARGLEVAYAADLNPLRELVRRLASIAGRLGHLTVAQTHGDFQPGNVLYRGEQVWLIDLEHAGVRAAAYDAFVWVAGMRRGGKIAARLVSLVTGGDRAEALLCLGRSSASRKANLAALLLEDLGWVVHEAENGPFRRLSPTLSHWVREVARGTIWW